MNQVHHRNIIDLLSRQRRIVIHKTRYLTTAIIGKARSTLSEILSLTKLPEEIRDNCRGDRTISRATLITIAKKKQTRAMTTA